jgi:uncharacterized protein (TIGR03083 family)
MTQHTDTGRLGPHAAAYRGAMDRITDLVAGIDDDAAAAVVPATPHWRVRDLLSHVAGTPTDLLAGRVEGAGSDAWTAAQVDARRDRTVADLLDEWETAWPAFADVLASFAERSPAPVLIFDVLTHEQDLRGALGRPPRRDPGDWSLPWAMAVDVVAHRRDRERAGALVLQPTDGEPAVAGSGDVTATVRAPTFELMRAATGRRSLAQMRAWTWTGRCSPEELCVFPPRDSDLAE